MMKIQAVKNTGNISFRSYTGITNHRESNNKMSEFRHQSHLMRDFETLMFAKNYVEKTFPKGIHIADFGCSNGEEAYSLLTLLHDANKDKKYKVTGYDIIPKVVEDAKKGIFKLSGDTFELYLKNELNFRAPSAEYQFAKNKFNDCFKEVPKNWNSFNIYHPRYKVKAKKINPANEDINLTLNRLEYMLLPNGNLNDSGKFYIPKKGMFDGVIDFKVGDILNLDKNTLPQNTGVVIFKNSLYHVIGSRTNDYENIDTKPALELFKKINKALPEDGLFVLGTLSHDHFFTHRDFEKLNSFILKNGKAIKAFNNSPIHKALREAGFKPIFYTLGDAYLPAIWKKVRHL